MVSTLCPAVCGVWLEGCRGRGPGRAFGTLLGPEATGSVVSGFPAHAGDRPGFPFGGLVAGGWV